MTIEKIVNGTELTVKLIGRLDTNTATRLNMEIETSLEGVESLVLDFAELVYLSSAGLRVLLFAQRIMDKQGKMVIRKVNDTIMEVFELTGFLDVLNIE